MTALSTIVTFPVIRVTARVFALALLLLNAGATIVAICAEFANAVMTVGPTIITLAILRVFASIGAQSANGCGAWRCAVQAPAAQGQVLGTSRAISARSSSHGGDVALIASVSNGGTRQSVEADVLAILQVSVVEDQVARLTT